MMGLIKNRHGVYEARKKVPTRLEEAIAKVLGEGKGRRSWLKRSLGTKNLREANIRVKPVLVTFDQTLARADAFLADRPLRQSLSQPEITRMVEWAQSLSYKLSLQERSPTERSCSHGGVTIVIKMIPRA